MFYRKRPGSESSRCEDILDSQKLYVMRNDAGLIKIGVSVNPESRARNLATSSGLGVEVVKVYDTGKCPARSVERQLHADFHDMREEGEWFKPGVMKRITPGSIERTIKRMATHRKKPSGSYEFKVTRKKLFRKSLYFTFESEQAGQEYCAKLERLLDQGIVPEEIAQMASEDRRTPGESLGKLVRDYLNTVVVKREDTSLLTLIVGEQGSQQVRDISHHWADGWIAQLKRDRQLAPGTIRKYVGALARCLDWGLRRGRVQANPLRSLAKGYSSYTDEDARHAGTKREDLSKDRRLEPGEEERLMAELRGPDKLLVTLALETGMRLSEIYTLDWDQVDLGKRTIFLDKTKNGHKRQVPLSSVAMAALTPKGEGLVLPYYDGDRQRTTSRLSRRFALAAERAGCPGLRFHDLRHEAACRLYERTTLSDLEIAKILGHSSTRMLARYANLRGADLSERLW